MNVPPPTYPSAKSLLKFALPTLILPLADPIMSLIDTICIGNFGTVLELAALGPASLLFGAASSLFSALTATALSDISGGLAQGNTQAAAQTFGEALQAAAVAGTAVVVAYGLFATQAVAALGVSAEVVPVAARYLFIRAFAAPAWKGTAICAVRASSCPSS
jgi:multidrug resistance protein, MATE family